MIGHSDAKLLCVNSEFRHFGKRNVFNITQNSYFLSIGKKTLKGLETKNLFLKKLNLFYELE